MEKNKTFKTLIRDGKTFNFLTLPDTNFLNLKYVMAMALMLRES